MKALQLLGPLLALAAPGLAFVLLRDLGPQASASAASATGLLLLGMGLPLLGLSARLLIPTSPLLCWPSMRLRFGIRGVWQFLWALNGTLSLLMLGTAGAFAIWWLQA